METKLRNVMGDLQAEEVKTDLHIEQNTIIKIEKLNEAVNTLQKGVDERDRIIKDLLIIIDNLKKKTKCLFISEESDLTCLRHGGLCCFEGIK